MLPKNQPQTSPTFDEGPYRQDPVRVANEALQVSTEVRDLVRKELTSLSERLEVIERYKKKEFGMFRTSWNSFWTNVGKVFNFVFSIEFFLVAAVTIVISLIVYCVWDSSKSEDNTARQACASANMSLVDVSNGRVTCLRPDGAVLVIRTYDNESPSTLVIPAISQTSSN